MKKNTTYSIINSDCLYALKEMASNSIDSIVTDSPYGISFQNADWDKDVASTNIWKEAYRVLKPGAFVLCFASTRTQHRVATRLEDCGFRITDTISWIYSQGYCRTENYEKNIKKRLEKNQLPDISSDFKGVGSKLRPSCEPIIMAQKPISEPTYTDNIIKYRCGGLNLDACSFDNDNYLRKPTNLIHDGSEAVLNDFPKVGQKCTSRFFYIAKPTRSEKNEGLLGMPKKSKNYTGSFAKKFNTKPQENHHPTVKGKNLMRHLVKLVTPKNGICLDIFNGSGTTGIACVLENYSYIGIELNRDYCLISTNRINAELKKTSKKTTKECTFTYLPPTSQDIAA